MHILTYFTQISEQFKKGEITLENAEEQALKETSSPSAAVTDSGKSVTDVPAASAVVMTPSVAIEQKPTTSSTEGSWKLWVLLMIMFIYLYRNHSHWNQVDIEISQLQSQINDLEAIINKLNK